MDALIRWNSDEVKSPPAFASWAMKRLTHWRERSSTEMFR